MSGTLSERYSRRKVPSSGAVLWEQRSGLRPGEGLTEIGKESGMNV